VLVEVREFMQNPERVRRRFLPSVVRLQALDDCLLVRAQRVDLPESAASAGAQESRSVLEDREFNAAWWETRLKFALRELPGQVVEGGAEVVKEVADDDREPQRDLEWGAYADDDLVPDLRIDEGIAVSVKEGVRLSIEALQVLVRPRQLLTDGV
jgi:hypothetical protein